MSADRRPNKNAATEDEVGIVHGLTNWLHTIRLQRMKKAIEQGADPEDVIGDGKALAAGGKWAADQNSITCAAPEANEETALAKSLRVIKEAQGNRGARSTGTDNIIPFTDGLED